MKAKYINEAFVEDSDPIKDMGIGFLDKLSKELKLDLSEKNPNELLVLAIKHDNFKLAEYALEAGANQLWWETGGTFGGQKGVTLDSFKNLTKIIKVKKNKQTLEPRHQSFTVYYVLLVSKFNNTNEIYSSKIFYLKYSPVDTDILNNVENNIKEIKKLL